MGEAWNAGQLPDGACIVTTADVGPQRIVSNQPVGLRWHNGVLEYARQWVEGTRGGIEWVMVPCMNDASAGPDTEGERSPPTGQGEER